MAIDRASRRVFIAMYRHKTAANAQRFLGDLERTGPIRIRTILTEKAFTDRLFGVRGRAATRQPAFETLCSTLGIDPRLLHQDRCKPTAWLSGSTALSRTSACSIWQRAGAALLSLALQPPACTISFGQQNFLARHQTMVQTQTGNCLPNSRATSRNVTTSKKFNLIITALSLLYLRFARLCSPSTLAKAGGEAVFDV